MFQAACQTHSRCALARAGKCPLFWLWLFLLTQHSDSEHHRGRVCSMVDSALQKSIVSSEKSNLCSAEHILEAKVPRAQADHTQAFSKT